MFNPDLIRSSQLKEIITSLSSEKKKLENIYIETKSEEIFNCIAKLGTTISTLKEQYNGFILRA